MEIGDSRSSTHAIKRRVDDAQPRVGCLGEAAKAQRVEGRPTHQCVYGFQQPARRVSPSAASGFGHTQGDFAKVSCRQRRQKSAPIGGAHACGSFEWILSLVRNKRIGRRRRWKSPLHQSNQVRPIECEARRRFDRTHNDANPQFAFRHRTRRECCLQGDDEVGRFQRMLIWEAVRFGELGQGGPNKLRGTLVRG